MKNPYRDTQDERIAVVDALKLLEWIGYTTPPYKTRETITQGKLILANRFIELASPDHKYKPGH